MPVESDSSIEVPSPEEYARLCAENAALKAVLQESLNTLIEDEKVGRVFHDFNNILSSSMGYANLALDRASASGDEKLIRYVDNIERAGIRARDLVRDSLNTRRDVRNVVKTSLYAALSESLGDLVMATDFDVHHSVAQLVLAFNFLASFYDGFDACKAEQVEDFNCHVCGQDLRGSQIKVTVETNGLGQDNESALALVGALINSQGGHLCAALLQDEQFVVYLRAVISE